RRTGNRIPQNGSSSKGKPASFREHQVRLRFTIRDLLWLTAVIAIGAGWLTDRAVMRDERQHLEQRQTELDLRMQVLSDERAILSDQTKAAAQQKQAYSEMNQQLEMRLHELNKSASSQSGSLPESP